MRPSTLLWLVVAAARAWDFPWSSTEEGWAPAEDAPRPEEDPFWVDREPCEADTRPPVHKSRAARHRRAAARLTTETGSRDKYFIRNRSKIARVDEETSLLSQTEENPFDPHNGLEITKF